MTMSVFSRRRAERFAELIEETDGSPRHHARTRLDGELAGAVAIGRQATALRPSIEHDSAFRPGQAYRAELRAMLVATAEREGIGATAVPDGAATVQLARPLTRHRATGRRQPIRPVEPSRRPGRRTIVIGVVAATMAVSGVAAASGGAMPGDPLYAVKRSTEQAQLALAGSDITRGQIYLNQARTRQAEASTVYRDVNGFTATLNDMDADTRQGVRLLTTAAADRHDPAALDAIDGFVSDQQSAVGVLLDRVDGTSRARVLDSLGLLDKVAKRSAALRNSMSCGASTGTSPGTDALGPKPRSCSAAAGSGGAPEATQPANGTGSTPGERSRKVHPTTAPGARTTPTGSTPGQLGGTPQPTLSPSPRPSPSDGGGLIGDLSRIVGNLLGG
jgi:hypothetical protein